MRDESKTGLPLFKRVFVNRSLNFANTKLVGFDMDHTLAIYKRDAFEGLAFRETIKKFIEAGYPEELLELEFKPNFLIRGLLVDKKNGNILKVDTHKYVKNAYHGYRRLSKEERYSLYNAQGIDPENFLSIDMFFELSEVQLYAEIVHFMNMHPGRVKKTFEEVHLDVRTFIDLCHKDGTIKNHVFKEPEKYIQRDKYLSTTLVRLIDAGKKLFLLTNSLYDYTKIILGYVLDNSYEGFANWKDYFEYMIVGAGKPGFFIGSQPFLEVVEEPNLLKLHSGPLHPKRVYYGGNAQLFEEVTGYSGDEILYVGDHIYVDIIRTKDTLNWRTMLIIEELEQEIPKLEELTEDLEKIFEKLQEKETLDERLQKIRSMIAANKRQVQKAEHREDMKKINHLLNENEKLIKSLEEGKQSLKDLDKNIKTLMQNREAKFHPVWGELMKVGLERSRFANQVNAYACLYTSRVSNLRYYSPFKKFISFHEVLPHDV